MSKNLDQFTKKITPAEYKQIVDSIELAEISLIELSISVNRKALMIKEKPKFRINEEYEVDHDKEFYRLTGKYKLDVPVSGRGKNPLIISIKYSARFYGPDDIPQEFWEIYKELLFPFQLWPYFRELIQSMTARMNIPPITLPIIHK